MHGAGLINHNFMRPNTSFIEILPCLFGGEWHDYSFQVPSKKQNIVFAWKIQAYNPVHCHPSRLESHTYRPGMLNAFLVTGVTCVHCLVTRLKTAAGASIVTSIVSEQPMQAALLP